MRGDVHDVCAWSVSEWLHDAWAVFKSIYSRFAWPHGRQSGCASRPATHPSVMGSMFNVATLKGRAATRVYTLKQFW